jgi:hypothetical protein
MQIQALLFFVLSATVLSRSVTPQSSLNTRAVGINSHSVRYASRSIMVSSPACLHEHNPISKILTPRPPFPETRRNRRERETSW